MTKKAPDLRTYVSPRPERLRWFTCRNCGQSRPSIDFRVPGLAITGPPLRACRECRATGVWWCNEHDEAHPKSEFAPHGSRLPDVFLSVCRRGLAERQWRQRGCRTYECEACKTTSPPFAFPHVTRNYCVCTACLDAHPGQRWCRACGWASLETFTQSMTSVERNSRDVRCDPCAQAHKHGATVEALLQLQGSTRRECAACTATEDLFVDHDHDCCGGKRAVSCGSCARGYLCRSCNIAEGVLSSMEQVRGLLDYMRRWDKPGFA